MHLTFRFIWVLCKVPSDIKWTTWQLTYIKETFFSPIIPRLVSKLSFRLLSFQQQYYVKFNFRRVSLARLDRHYARLLRGH